MKVKDNPVLSRAALAALVAAVVSVLNAVGVEISPEVSAAVVDLAVGAAPIIAIVWAAWSARKRVTPVTREVPAEPATPVEEPEPDIFDPFTR